jgi:hypothetical protein
MSAALLTRKPESNRESARAEKSGRTKGVQTFGLPAREMRVARTQPATPRAGALLNSGFWVLNQMPQLEKPRNTPSTRNHWTADWLLAVQRIHRMNEASRLLNHFCFRVISWLSWFPSRFKV